MGAKAAPAEIQHPVPLALWLKKMRENDQMLLAFLIISISNQVRVSFLLIMLLPRCAG
jgi:hypothetical protein